MRKGKKGTGARRGQLTSRYIIKKMQNRRREIGRKGEIQRTLGFKSTCKQDSETQLKYNFI